MNKKYISLLTLAISLTFVILLYPQLQNPDTLGAFVSQWGWLGIFVNLLLIMLLALFPVVPFILIAGVNTLLFGWVGGFLLSLAGSLLGASLGFWLARTLGQEWAQPEMEKLGKWGVHIEDNSFTIILIARLIPVLPSAAINYAAGLSLMPFPKFLLATFIGKIPMVIWESWVGHNFWQITNHPGRLLLSLTIGALFFGFIGLYWYFYIKRLKSRSTDQE